ncbi:MULTISPECIES: septal ring lytic transglycosylase RlpA family protein [unclassified Lysobacter]
MKRLLVAILVIGLASCASAPEKPATAPGAAADQDRGTSSKRKSPYPAAKEDLSKRGDYTAGGLYAPHIADSAPDVDIDVSLIPEPTVVAVDRSRYGNRSTYSVLGKKYHVMDDSEGYVERGKASYYGNKFHGRRTSNMEVYDMYAFTAAHKTLPLPSFAQVTNLDNGKTVVVRVNDRGPFHEGRVIDLSYAAALKLGITQAGTGRVEVRALQPGEGGSTYAGDAPATNDTAAVAAATPAAPASSMDKLVASLPVAAAGAVKLPPGVRIATGKPSPAAGAAESPATAPAVAAASTAGTVAAPGSTAQQWRFDMNQDGRTMTAEEFDTWMQQRRVRVATGRPGKPDRAATTASPVTDHPASPAQAAAEVANAVAAGATASDARVSDESVTLQVASFAGRDNADRALAMLRGAGIADASLQDAKANGQRVWRLRVGPLHADAAPALASRIAGLGFGAPQRVIE